MPRREPRAGDDLLALAAGEERAAGPLLGLRAAEDVEPDRPALGHKPPAGAVRGPDDHVHAVSVGGPVDEVDHDLAAQRTGLDPQQPAVPGGGFGFALQRLEESRQVAGERRRFGHAVEHEDRRDAVLVRQDARRDAAGPGEGDHAPLIGAHQRPLRGGQRDVEEAARVLACDRQRTRDAHRHLHGADRVFDIAAHLLAGDAGRADVLEARRRSAPRPSAAARRGPLACSPARPAGGPAPPAASGRGKGWDRCSRGACYNGSPRFKDCDKSARRRAPDPDFEGSQDYPG